MRCKYARIDWIRLSAMPILMFLFNVRVCITEMFTSLLAHCHEYTHFPQQGESKTSHSSFLFVHFSSTNNFFNSIEVVSCPESPRLYAKWIEFQRVHTWWHPLLRSCFFIKEKTTCLYNVVFRMRKLHRFGCSNEINLNTLRII